MANDSDELPDHELLTWTDKLKASVQPTLLQTDSSTGQVYNPKRRYLEERIRVRKAEMEAKMKGEKGS